MAESSVENTIRILQKCRTRRSLACAKQLYAQICHNGLKAHKILGNHVVPMFIECGSISDSQQAFQGLFLQNEHSWTSLISGYVEYGQSKNGINLYIKMQENPVYPSCYTYMALLKACGKLRDVERGRHIHLEITRKGFIGDPFLGSALVNMYAKCGSVLEAQSVFQKLPIINVVLCNALITGYVENGLGYEALKCFERMQVSRITPDAVTIASILKVYGSIGAIDKTREIHAKFVNKEYERDPFIAGTLIDTYAKTGLLADARKVFDHLPVRDVVVWSALIKGYSEHGSGQEALKCFHQMLQEGVSPDAGLFICCLKACGKVGALDKGREIHTLIKKMGFGKDLTVSSSLIDMYAKCGSMVEARDVFDYLPIRDVASWNSLIAGYAEHGIGNEALICFGQMQLDCVSPDAVMFACSLKSCSTIEAVERGRGMHSEIVRKGFEQDPFVGCSLIDMYAKCGLLVEAQGIFKKFHVQDAVLWNAMIRGYGMNQEGNKAVHCFEEMGKQGVKPDSVTFLCLLNACSRSCLVFKGKRYFKLMGEEYGIVAEVDHYTCMVDLLGRSGCLYEAEKLLETAPFSLCNDPWTALLSACKTFGEAECGLRCFQKLVEMGAENATPYVLMANIYSSIGRWDDARSIEELRKHAEARNRASNG